MTAILAFLAASQHSDSAERPNLSVSEAVKAQLGPALYYRLAETGQLNTLPLDEQRVLHHAFMQNAKRNLVFEVELRRILTAFAARTLPIMPLKGGISSFLQPLYPSPAIRVLSDLDLLIRPRDREEAFSCLVSLGYTPAKKVPLPEVERIFTQDRVLVDLHWQVIRIPRYADADGLWRRAHPVECSRGVYYLPPLLDQLYMRFLHDTLQDHELPAGHDDDGVRTRPRVPRVPCA
jgi:hypothetical protein